MKTPLKPSLDEEIYEIEERLARRRAELPRVARATGKSALHALASPAGLAAAAALGFLAGGGLRRKNGRRAEPRWVKVDPQQQKTKGIAIGSLAMSAAIALIKAQFGSPLEMARVVLAKLQSRHKPQAVPASPRRPRATSSPSGDRHSVAG
ncbi:MAG TPA: hypothetical protein VFZ74_18190 [Burkholderiales bacterium]